MLTLLLLLAAQPPGVVIDHQPPSTRQYVGSPSIAILNGGAYVASHDVFGPGSTQSTSAVTRVFRSEDRGQTWAKTTEFPDQFWSNLFVHRGKLYLMGTTCKYGRIVMRRSDDGGRTWSAPSMLSSGTGYHTAPVPIVEDRGRLWRAMEFHPEGKWGYFEALVISAPVKADLLDAKNWTMTPRIPYPIALAPEGKHWLEGNIVRLGRGRLVNVLRVDNVEKAAIVRLDSGKLVFDALVDFPGGAKKFTIRYDRKTRRYWALSNPAPAGSPQPAAMRNTLALLSSKDLRQWKVERVTLSHPDPLKHAFQYVDWQFDGNDLIVASRTAFEDDDGGPPRGHDANYLTFHRVANFRANASHP
jgi:hypothetical protein